MRGRLNVQGKHLQAKPYLMWTTILEEPLKDDYLSRSTQEIAV